MEMVRELHGVHRQQPMNGSQKLSFKEEHTCATGLVEEWPRVVDQCIHCLMRMILDHDWLSLRLLQRCRAS
jgi:hypothetical protein